MSATGACLTSRSFWTAHLRCQPRATGERTFEYPMFPDMTLMAFSIEVGLKALLARHGLRMKKNTHEIWHLYQALPEDVRAQVFDASAFTQAEFTRALFELNDAFVKMRYAYEKESVGADLDNFRRLGAAVQATLDRYWPRVSADSG